MTHSRALPDAAGFPPHVKGADACKTSSCGSIVLILLSAICASIFPQSQARAAAVSEYEVKAVFLLNFAQFVDWPASTFANPNEPFCIGILGDDPFGPVLDQVIAGENVHNRKLTVKRSRRVEDLKTCQLLFISSSERGQVTQALEEVNKASILTVSEIAGFADRGGMVNFYLSDGKVRFEINRGAAERRGLKISSQLLKVARIVD